MASITKKTNKKGTIYYITYRVPDANGIPKQHWYRTDCTTLKEAEKKKTEVEVAEKAGQLYFEENKLSFMVSDTSASQKNLLVSELLEQYISEYGTARWEPSTLSAHAAIAQNYINPIIGDIPVRSITPHILQEYYNSLLKMKAKKSLHHKKRGAKCFAQNST